MSYAEVEYQVFPVKMQRVMSYIQPMYYDNLRATLKLIYLSESSGNLGIFQGHPLNYD